MGNPIRLFARPTAVFMLALLLASSVYATDAGVKDDAGYFSANAVRQADATLKELKRKYNHTVVVETFATPPNELAGRLDGDEATRKSAYASFMEMRVRSLGTDVYVFINKFPGHVDIARREDVKRSGLTEDGRRRMAGDLLAKFRDKQFDAALTGMTESLAATYAAGGPVAVTQTPPADRGVAIPPPAARTAPADRTPPANAPARTSENSRTGDPSDNRGFFGSLGCFKWVIIGAVVLLVISLIRRLFAGRQQQNYGPGGQGGQGGPGGYGAPGGYGPGQYGNNPGGGGGFGRGLGGGILGGLLGSWIGGNVFGQGHSSGQDTGASSGGGHDSGNADAGSSGISSGGGDFDSGPSYDSGSDGISSGGGDFGGDSGGGDSGGGGGDF